MITNVDIYAVLLLAKKLQFTHFLCVKSLAQKFGRVKCLTNFKSVCRTGGGYLQLQPEVLREGWVGSEKKTMAQTKTLSTVVRSMSSPSKADSAEFVLLVQSSQSH